MIAFVCIITKEGIYRHEIMGVFDSEKSADDHAVTSLKKEYDNCQTQKMMTMACICFLFIQKR